MYLNINDFGQGPGLDGMDDLGKFRLGKLFKKYDPLRQLAKLHRMNPLHKLIRKAIPFGAKKKSSGGPQPVIPEDQAYDPSTAQPLPPVGGPTTYGTPVAYSGTPGGVTSGGPLPVSGGGGGGGGGGGDGGPASMDAGGDVAQQAGPPGAPGVPGQDATQQPPPPADTGTNHGLIAALIAVPVVYFMAKKK